MDGFGDDFPTTALDFHARFATEEACVEYFTKLRWPDGFTCPKCGGKEHWWLKKRELYDCKACRHQTSLTAGTSLEGTRKPLRHWLYAMFLMTSQKTSTSAMNVKRQLHISYPTAWTWLQKLRFGVGARAQSKLTGRVEVDESFVGGVEAGHRGRGAEEKALVVGAVEDRDGNPGRIRLEVKPDASAESLEGFVATRVEVGATAHTDGWSAYRGVAEHGIGHEPETIRGSGKTAAEMFPLVHLVFALLKRWLLGTFQGAVGNKHLQGYLDEFTFRFNRRHCRNPLGIFERLARTVLAASRVTYRAIIAREPTQFLARAG
ncbi:MAG: IS1595 family transposase [Thermoplasmata archaeon]